MDSPLEQMLQDQVWTDVEGVTRPLDYMTHRHRANLRAWLIRNAPGLMAQQEAQLVGLSRFITSEHATDDLEHAMATLQEMPPRVWLREWPLYRRLTLLVAQDRRNNAG